MSLVSITNQSAGCAQQTTKTDAAESFSIKRPFDKATQTILDLFTHIQETSALTRKQADVVQLHHEITCLRNASLEDRREVLAANRHLAKKELEKLKLSELKRGRDMEARIDALMQQTTQLLDAEIKTQLSLHAQGKRSEILSFYQEAQKVLKITSPQTQFERNWDFAKCLYEEEKFSESVAIIKEISSKEISLKEKYLPVDVQKLFDSIADSPSKESLEHFFQVAEQAETKKHIKTVSDEQYRPKTLADILSQPAIMKVFLKYVNPVTLMRLSRSCHESVKKGLPSAYLERRAKSAKDLHAFSLVSAPDMCRELIVTAVAALWQNGLEYQNLDPRLQNDVGIAKIALLSLVQKGTNPDIKKLFSLFPEHINAQLTEYLSDIKKTCKVIFSENLFQEKGTRQSYLGFLTNAFIKKFPNDKDICLIMVQVSGCLLEYASAILKNDKEIVMLAVKQNGKALYLASDRLKSDKEIFMEAVKQNGKDLMSASAELKDNEDIVMAAVKQNGEALKYASDRLKSDKKIVIAAVTQNGRVLNDVDDNLRDDKEIVMAAVTQKGSALKYASDKLKDDKEIVMAAVKQNREALYLASKRLQSNKEIFMLAVKRNGKDLMCASAELKDNEDIVMAAVKQNEEALYYASDRLKSDKKIVIAAVTQNGRVLNDVGDNLRDDKEIVMAAVTQNADALEYASDGLQDDKEIVMVAVTQKGSALKYASDKLKDDKEIVMAAVIQNRFALRCASDRLKDNEEIVMAAVKQNGDVLSFASDRLKNDKEIVIVAIKQDGLYLVLAGDNLKDDDKIVMEAVTKKGLALKYASDRLQNDKEIVMAAVSQNGDALSFASDRLKNDKEIVMAAYNQKKKFRGWDIFYLDRIERKFKKQLRNFF